MCDKPDFCYQCDVKLDWEKEVYMTDGNDNYFCSYECLCLSDPSVKEAEDELCLVDFVDFQEMRRRHTTR